MVSDLPHRYPIPHASLRGPAARSAVLALFVALTGQLALKHVSDITLKVGTPEGTVTILWTVVFVIIVHELVMSWFERPFTIDTAEQRARVDRLKVVVNVPVYNESAQALDRALYSLSRQTRRPDVVHVVDDGSTTSRYPDVEAHWAGVFAGQGVDFRWTRVPHGLKRRAQMTTFAQPTDPDDRREEILVTMDSDTALDRRAVAEGLKPFADPGVASVAGFELAYNQYQGGLFTMVGGLAQTVWQLNTCGAQNVTGRVQVNRGTLAFYRSVVFRAHAEGYLDERWFGRRVEFSDDSRATLTAQRYGRSVQQPTCFQFTLTPLTWGHTLRQRLRWMRGSQVRDVSRLRELPAGTYAFWMVHLKWVLYFLASVALGAALAIIDFTPVKVAYLIGMPLLVAYLCALRYLTLRRSDETLGQQLATFALAPLVVLRSATVFKVLRLYALATCLKVDVWGTRAGVEVEAVEAPVREPLRVGDGW